MDKDKFKIFRSGISEEQREEIARDQAVQAQFKAEKDKVNSTMRSKGFKVILDKITSDMQIAKSKLVTCKPKDLLELQLEIKVRSEFLHHWSPYVD